ncbi:MAG: hypothetical protein FH751_14015 [Firmicutes bacterium]|nr:hypothetical protein [Bacillota bacterium]
MKSKIFSFVLISFFAVTLISCNKVKYSSNFAGIPIYPTTELSLDADTGKNSHSEMYLDPYFKEDYEKAIEYFMKNIDKSIWDINEVENQPLGTLDKIKAYKLTSGDKKVTLTIGFSKSEKTGRNLIVSIVGNKLTVH